ncbi:MAG: purine-binding chemotaxis protein CheW [Gammaproteobacteria bacterium]|jgi:purine-binding chemotaxis protein CheW|nr:purine-binding chemotaxis protein CheW [Gammaproteobacteria bacterium]MBT3722651.1 purine-binding chemotaxis protein CheW [Gammaproteobacteria bacterium]MBT4075475.1 purine-binding chemotaxis protein CheW [Gammaproteobacteria bacterium]MBT4193029.1 purine-binding chemotaxis protein CheW [Gammaproteobacteria bacterium]MBT4451048.1 purine-binding chemotaxis protein CheW [Gammaproteobacteria bacterium]
MSAQNITEDITHLSSVNQYLTFRVGKEDYGIKILSVQEIRGWETVARVPNTPHYIKGVLNLRGTAVPVIDMRLRMDLTNPKYDNTTVLIVVRAEINGDERIAGIVVDAVSDVMNARSDEIRKTPDFGDRVNTEFISGLVDVGGKMVMLFDVDTFMKHSDIYEHAEEAE